MDAAPIRTFVVGDTVYAKVQQRASGRGHGKSKVKYRPATIVGVGHRGGYTIKFVGENVTHTRNVGHLKPRPTWNEEELDEAEGRNRGREESRILHVDRILDMEYRKDADKKSVTYVKLSWVGYPESSATWERQDSITSGRRRLVNEFYTRHPNHVPRYNNRVRAEPPVEG